MLEAMRRGADQGDVFHTRNHSDPHRHTFLGFRRRSIRPFLVFGKAGSIPRKVSARYTGNITIICAGAWHTVDGTAIRLTQLSRLDTKGAE
jgi:hypothetical protein